MTTEEHKRLVETCEQVAIDTENDAKDFDGKPFTGISSLRLMAEYMGNHGAAIVALSNVLKAILEDNPHN